MKPVSGEKAEELERPIAWRLKQARESQGLSLEQMEQRTNIFAHQLKALEEGDFDVFPSLLWARKLTIIYADHLRLDGEALAETLFPYERAYRRKLRRLRLLLRHHWQLPAAVLGVVVIVGMIGVLTIIDPYSNVATGINNFLNRVVPGVFLGSEPQRIVITASTRAGATASTRAGAFDESSVMAIKVAQDGLGVLAIPRNTAVEIPGHRKGAIGDALSQGPPDLARRTVARFTGVEVPYYMALNAVGIREIVDEMGGVRIRVLDPAAGKVPGGGPEVSLRPGMQTLNGDQALVYLEGQDLPSDVERAERQQAFLQDMLRQALSFQTLLSNPTTLRAVFENVQTNMSATEAVELAARFRALKNTDASIQTQIVPGREESPSGSRRGNASSDYWLPDTHKLLDAVKETLR